MEDNNNNINKNIHKGHRQRVKNLVANNGFNNMLDYQILEYILFFAIPYKDTNALAHKLIRKFGSLDKVLDADISSLVKVDCMTQNAGILLNSIPKILVEYEKSKNKPQTVLSINNILPYLRSLTRLKHNECMYLVSLDGKNAVIATDQISSGNNSLYVYSKNLAKTAMFRNAHSVILCHNHPSGDANPSLADIENTDILNQTLAILDINLIDHIIIGHKEIYSFYLKEKLKEKFEDECFID